MDEHDRRFDEHTGKLNELISVVNGHSSKLDELAAVLRMASNRRSMTSEWSMSSTLSTQYSSSGPDRPILLPSGASESHS